MQLEQREIARLGTICEAEQRTLQHSLALSSENEWTVGDDDDDDGRHSARLAVSKLVALCAQKTPCQHSLTACGATHFVSDIGFVQTPRSFRNDDHSTISETQEYLQRIGAGNRRPWQSFVDRPTEGTINPSRSLSF